MATQALVEQTVLFISSIGEYDENALYANSLVQSLAANSAATALVGSYQSYQTWNGSVWTAHTFYQIKCFVTAAFTATIQANIPALQAAFPNYTVITYGHPVTFGN